MSDGGCLSNACPLRREVPELSPIAARLARFLGIERCGDDKAVMLFGVSLATLHRIRDGDVDPDDVFAERIGRALDAAGYSDPAAEARPPAGADRAPPLGAADGEGAAPTGEEASHAPHPGGALYPLAGGPCVCGHPVFTLRTHDHGGAEVLMHVGGAIWPLPISIAEQMHEDLLDMILLAVRR